MRLSLLLLSFTLFISFSIHSQTRFNFTTGMTLSSFTENLMDDYGFEEARETYINDGGSATTKARNSIRTGFYIAAEVDFFINESRFIKTGLKFTSLGDSFYFKTDDVEYQGSYGSTSDAKYIVRPRLDYFALPVNLGTQFTDNFSIYGGFTPHILINNIIRYNYYEAKGSGTEVKQEWERQDNFVTAKKTVIFGNVGLTYMDEVNNPRIIFDLRISRSLSSVYADNRINNSISEINSAGLWSIELGMGIALFSK